MSNSDANVPKFKEFQDGEPIPPVDPEDVKRLWYLKSPWKTGDQEAACSPGADVQAVFLRRHMIDTLNIFELLTPWQHGEERTMQCFELLQHFRCNTCVSKGFVKNTRLQDHRLLSHRRYSP